MICLLVKFVEFSLYSKKILVANLNHQYLQKNLDREPAHYNFMETIARGFINPSRQNQFIEENILINAPKRRIAVVMNTNQAVAGFIHKNFLSINNFI